MASTAEGSVAPRNQIFVTQTYGNKRNPPDRGFGDSAQTLLYEGIPTEEEYSTLRRIPDRIPWHVYSIAFVELCERFSYYGTITVCEYRFVPFQFTHSI